MQEECKHTKNRPGDYRAAARPTPTRPDPLADRSCACHCSLRIHATPPPLSQHPLAPGLPLTIPLTSPPSSAHGARSGSLSDPATLAPRCCRRASHSTRPPLTYPPLPTPPPATRKRVAPRHSRGGGCIRCDQVRRRRLRARLRARARRVRARRVRGGRLAGAGGWRLPHRGVGRAGWEDTPPPSLRARLAKDTPHGS